jgi:hypothetical protein
MPKARVTAPKRYSRAIVAIDVSRSFAAMRPQVKSIVDKLLGELGTGTKIEVILFSRDARRVLGKLRLADRETRMVVDRAIDAAGSENGSGFGKALDLVAEVFAETPSSHGKTLVAVITDGLIATSFGANDALAQIGAKALQHAQVVNVVLVPDEAPFPDLAGSALSALTLRTRGRNILWRTSDVASQAGELLRLVSQIAPAENLSLVLDGAKFVGAELPTEIPVGAGAFALGFYEGSPKGFRLQGRSNGQRKSFALTKMPSARAKLFAKMVLASASPGSFPLEEKVPRWNEEHAARKALLKSAANLGVVNQEAAAVLLDKKDGFAADRLALALKWGTSVYRRVRPKPELLGNGAFRPFRPAIGTRLSHSPTGQLGRDLVKRLIQQHVLPNARRCYNKLIRTAPQAEGELTLVLELARGEVHEAAIHRGSLSLSPINKCILDSAYAIPVPPVKVGTSAELISVARYPLRFRFKGKPIVDAGPKKGVGAGFDPTDPLSGLPEDGK